MKEAITTPVAVLNLFLQGSDEPLSEKAIRTALGVEQREIRKILDFMVVNELLVREQRGRQRRYTPILPDSPEDIYRFIGTLTQWEQNHPLILADEPPEINPPVEAAGSISRFLDHMVFLEEIASIILTSRKFSQVFRETFRRLISAVNYDLGFAVTVGAELKVHVIAKKGVSEGLMKKALTSTRELLNLIVALPFIPGEMEIVEKIEEMDQSSGKSIRHRIGASFERDRMTPGLLAIYRLEDMPFLADEKQVLDVLGSQMTLACRNINAMERIRQLALTDDLTGINNKRYFRLIYQQEFQRARRYDYPLVVCMIDLDHFKKINDRWGHQQGDVVLSELAALILRMVRTTDIFARYGGEEFVLLFPHTNLDEAARIAEQIRSTVEGYDFPGETVPIHCTLSMGVALMGPEDITPESLMARADASLYQAKAQGRNLVITD